MVPPLLRRIKQTQQNRSDHLHNQGGLLPLLRPIPVTRRPKYPDDMMHLDEATDVRNSDDEEVRYLLDDPLSNKSDQSTLYSNINRDRIMVSRTVDVSSAPFSAVCDLEPLSQAHIGVSPRSGYL